MIEFFLGVLVSPYLWGMLLLLSFFAEANNASGWCGFMWTLLLGVLLFSFQPGFALAVTLIVGYLLSGVLWSIFRYRKYISDAYENWKENKGRFDKDTNTVFTETYYFEKLSPKECSGKITYWAIYWPPSLITYLLGDFAKEAIMKIGGKTFGTFYNNLAAKAVNEYKPKEDSPLNTEK
jgi:hypothetical protein